MRLRNLLLLTATCVLSYTSFAQAPGATPPLTPPANAAPAQSSAAPGAPPNAAAATKPTANPEAVGADQPVITLKGACTEKGGEKPASDCVSVVTKAQFEKLTNALRPNMPPEVKRSFATQYAKLLIFDNAAKSMGLENDARVLEVLQFAKGQILVQALNQKYSEQYEHPSDQQIQEYYNQNSKKYEEATLQRIIVPRPVAKKDVKVNEADEKAYAEKLRQRWMAGEDATKLQKEAMEHGGVQTPPPDVNVGARRRGSLPVTHEAVFDLKAGEVSTPFGDPSAFYLYKVSSTRQIPVSEVKPEISRVLQTQLLQEKMDEVSKSATPELNETYFGPEPAKAPTTIAPDRD